MRPSTSVHLARLPGDTRTRPRNSMRRFASTALVALVSLGATLFAGGPALAAETNLRILNSFRYVSDEGTATFLPAFSSGNLSFDGNMRFYTGPGQAGTVIGSNGYSTESATSNSGPVTLPAYAADGSTTPIGLWKLPQGSVVSTSPERAITLQLDSAHLDFAGTIRPLRVALADPSESMQCALLASQCIGTMYPLTLAATQDSVFSLTASTGVAPLAATPGSCINGTNGQSGNGGMGEITMNSCREGITVALLDAAGAPQQSLPMLDAAGGTIGQWSLSQDAQSVSWTLSIPLEQVSSVEPVTYQVSDVRNESWSGWWNQSLGANSEPAPQSTTYDTARLMPEVVAPTPATASPASAETTPEAAIVLTPVFSAGTMRGGAPAALQNISVTPDNPAQGSWTAHANGTVTFAPAQGVHATTATAFYTVTSANGTTATSTLAVTVAQAEMLLTLEMSTDSDGVQQPTLPSQPIVYTFVLQNTGKVELSNVSLTNSLVGLGNVTFEWPGAPGHLAVGQSARGTITYEVTAADISRGSVVNTATAGGVYGSASVSSEQRTSTVKLPPVSSTPTLPITGASANVPMALGVAGALALALGSALILIRSRATK